MPTFYPIQTNFTGGVISPRQQGAVDARQYNASLNNCENFDLTPQGNIKKRIGTQRLDNAANLNSRLFNFPRTGDRDYIVEVNESVVRIWSAMGRVQQGSTSFVTDPTFENALNSWQQTIDPATGQTGRQGRITAIPGTGVRMRNTIRPNLTETTIVSLTQLVTLGPANSSHTITAFFRVNQYDEIVSGDQYGGVISISLRNATTNAVVASDSRTYGDVAPGPPPVSIPAFGTTVQLTFTYTPTTTGENLNFVIEQRGGSPNGHYTDMTWENIQIRLTADSPMDIEFPSPWTVEQVRELQVATDTASQAMVLVHRNVEPRRLQNVNDVLVFEEAPFVEAPTEWTDENWPSVVEFYQGRLILAGTPAQAGTIWGSRVGAIFNFTVPTTPAPNDAYIFELLTNGAIQWIRGGKVLLIGTDRDEWTGASSTGIITSDDFQFIKQSELGSAYVRAIFCGDQLVNVSRDQQRIRAINFDGVRTETYASLEISLHAENLLRDDITRIEYVRDPLYQLFCLNSAGELRVCMLDRLSELAGWYTYTTEGTVMSIVASQDLDGDVLWLMVNRAGTAVLEIYRPNTPVPEYLDSWARTSVATIATGSFSDFANAEYNAAYDIQVTALGDKPIVNFAGSPYGTQTVSCYIRKPDGRILQHRDVALASGANETFLDRGVAEIGDDVVLGLPYTATAQTLPLERSSQTGTSQGRLRRFNRIFARLINDSGIPLINNRLPRVRGLAAAPEFPAFTGDVEIRDIGQRKQGVITLEQADPVNTEINSLFGKASFEVL